MQTAANWQHSNSRQSSVKGGASSLKLVMSSFCLHSQWDSHSGSISPALIMKVFDIYCGYLLVEGREKGGVWIQEALPLCSVTCHILYHMVVSLYVPIPLSYGKFLGIVATFLETPLAYRMHLCRLAPMLVIALWALA